MFFALKGRLVSFREERAERPRKDDLTKIEL